MAPAPHDHRPGSRARTAGDEPIPCWMATDALTELLVDTDLVDAPPATASARSGGPVRLVAPVKLPGAESDVGAVTWLIEWSVGQRLWQAIVPSDRLVSDGGPS